MSVGRYEGQTGRENATKSHPCRSGLTTGSGYPALPSFGMCPAGTDDGEALTRETWPAHPPAGRRGELVEDIGSDIGQLLTPFGGALGKRVIRAVFAEWQSNRSTALRAAEVASGMSREQFAEWAEADARAVPLYLKVLWAAGMNGHDQTLRALGAVLGRAARASAAGDDHQFDQAELALRAMADLTPRHFLVLGLAAQGRVAISEDGSENYRELTPKYLAPLAGIPDEVVHQCLLNLAGAGLTVAVVVLEATAYPVTELGRAVAAAAQLREG